MDVIDNDRGDGDNNHSSARRINNDNGGVNGSDDAGDIAARPAERIAAAPPVEAALSLFTSLCLGRRHRWTQLAVGFSQFLLVMLLF